MDKTIRLTPKGSPEPDTFYLIKKPNTLSIFCDNDNIKVKSFSTMLSENSYCFEKALQISSLKPESSE